MASMNISLPGPMRDWVKTKISDGEYSSNSDYVRDLIRKDQQRQVKIHAIQQAITEGLNSGDPQNFDKEAFKKRMLASLDNADL